MTMASKQPPVQTAHGVLSVTRPASSSNMLDMHPNSGNSGTNLSVGIVGQQPPSHMDVNGGPLAPSPFGNRAIFQSGELPPQTVSGQQHGIIVSSAQSTLDHSALYTPVSAPGYGPDPQSHNAALLKMVQGGGDLQSVPQQQQPQQQQQQQQHPMLSSYHHQHSHHHPMSYSQTKPNLGVSSSQVNTNTTVSMSRLNPSAPDFSLHLTSKPQQQQQQQPPPPPPPQQQQPQQQPPPPPPPQQGGSMFSATATFHQRASVLPPPSSLQTSASALGTMLPNISFPLGKSSLGPYHHQPLPGPAPGPAANGQRWPLFQAPYHHPHHPPDVMSQMSFSGNMAHLASLAASLAHPGNSVAAADMLAGLENGAIVGGVNSPVMSPSSPASVNPGPAGEPSHHKLEDRKIPPRPIGTERASWKNNYGNMSGVGAGGDLDPNWLLGGGDPKMPVSSWVGAGINHSMERHQMYRSSASHYGRLPTADELPHMMDAPFQVHSSCIYSSMMI